MPGVSDLIGTTTTTEPAELRLYHRNPRRGDVQAIANSLRSNSQYRPLTANIGTLTGRPNEILAGNHTAMALWALAEEDPADPRWKSVQVHWVDVDDEGCRRIVLADNRTAELGGFDTAELVALLDGMSGVELADVGYSLADYADLQAALEEQDTDLTAILDRAPPRTGEDGLTAGKDITEQADAYPDGATRMIVLMMSIPDFVWAQDKLETLRAQRGVETNTAAVLTLLADWSGDAPPTQV